MKDNNFAEKHPRFNNYSRRLIGGTVGATMGINSPSSFAAFYGKGMTRLEMMRMFESQSKFKLVWYSVFVTFALVFLCFVPSSYITVIDLLIFLVNIDLVSRGRVVGVYIGIAECVLYAFICFGSGLYGEVFKMCAINIPINVYTIISWTKNLKQSKSGAEAKTKSESVIEVKKLGKRGIALSLLSIVAATGVSYLILRFVLGQTVSLLLGACTLGISIVYKILSGSRFMESWIFGLVQSSINLFMWISTLLIGNGTISDLPVIASLLAVISNNVFGFVLWNSLYKKRVINGAVILNKRPLKISKIITLRRRYKKLRWNRQAEAAHQSAMFDHN
ncbi:MAG: nicotinamide mononucleotide transporter [Clostridia bacterium]|nr:nicotinamide mononucleotide transporter [Clostridia bacterium]